MRKVHLISVSEPLIIDLAVAIREKGYEVSVSGEGLTESLLALLREKKCTYYGEGWYPERLDMNTNFVVLGSTVQKDNPELIRAKELGLLVQSVPEFIFHRTKRKTRVVVTGSSGKRETLSMIAHALECQNLKFDYAISTLSPVLPRLAKMSYEARIALIEGDALVTSELEARFQLEFYRPHIAVISTLEGEAVSQQKDDKDYFSIYESFIASIEREGKLIYFSGDDKVKQLASGIREDITAIPYDERDIIEKDGKQYIQTRFGEFQVNVTDPDFLLNINAAHLVCRQLGVKDETFFKAISTYYYPHDRS